MQLALGGCMPQTEQSARTRVLRMYALVVALYVLSARAPLAHAESANLGAADSAAECEDTRCVAVPAAAPSPLLYVPRLLLMPVRLALRGAFEVLLIAPRLEDEYQLQQLAKDVFFDDTQTYGLFPTAFYETGLAPNIGLRFVHKNLFGAREGLLVRAGYGGIYNQIYEASAHSGQRFSALRVSAGVRYRVNDRVPFFGIGNADAGRLDSRAPPQSVIDPPIAVKSHYRARELRTLLTAQLALRSNLWVALTESLRQRALSRATRDSHETPWVADAYEGSQVIGFETPMVDSYSELSLRWDERRQIRADLPREIPSSGFLLTNWLGVQHFLAGLESTFGRVGFDLQSFIDLYRGNRVLRLRVRGAMLLGSPASIPFVDYLNLTGSSLLRGYQALRFRGLATVLVSIEYRYPVQENIQSFLFVDAGRALASLSDELLPARVGFGAGLSVHTFNRAMFRFELSTSIDGGAFVALRLDSIDATSQTL